MSRDVEQYAELCSIDCKRYIGIVSRQLPSIVSLSESKVHIISECPVDIPVGSYLVIEARTSNKKYLARVAESTLQDVYAIAKMPVLSIEQELLVHVRPLPRLVAVDLVVECQDNVCTAPVTPVEIHSLVRFPEPGEISKMLNLPQSGLKIGYLALPDGRYFESEHVYLPELALHHHILVVGTTGSGKTVFLKNLIYELLRSGTGRALVLDTVGHYHHVVFPELRRLCVILPVTRRYARRLKYLASKMVDKVDQEEEPYKIAALAYALAIAQDYIDRTFLAFGIPAKLRKVKVKAKYRQENDNSWIILIKHVDIELLLEKHKVNINVRVYPWALETSNVILALPRLTPIFTAQARMFYRIVLRELLRLFLSRQGKGSIRVTENNISKICKEHNITLEDLYNFMLQTYESDKSGSHGRRTSVVYEVIAESIGVHRNTIENMVRGFLSLVETDLFDVFVRFKMDIESDNETCTYEFCIKFAEPDYERLFREENYVVIDLRESSGTQQRLVVYRVLDKLYKFVDKYWRKLKLGTVLVAIDEAHTFFPQAREESEKELIENYLTMLARLGRAKGIGLVFATHSPDDLNDLVLQLTNTKIVLRSEEKILEKLGVPSQERRALVLAPPGLAYVRSFVYKVPIFVRLEPAKVIHVG